MPKVDFWLLYMRVNKWHIVFGETNEWEKRALYNKQNISCWKGRMLYHSHRLMKVFDMVILMQGRISSRLEIELGLRFVDFYFDIPDYWFTICEWIMLNTCLVRETKKPFKHKN